MKTTIKLCKEISPRKATIRPMFTHRVHRPPVAKGHRCFVLGKVEWR